MKARTRQSPKNTRRINDASDTEFPLDASVGALVRYTHRAFADDLQTHLQQHEVNVGMWYFLRALWEDDGLTQRELSRLIGVSEPTAAQQLKKMEANQLISRQPSTSDRRKIHVHLTQKGRALRQKLIPYALEVNAAATEGIDMQDLDHLRRTLEKILHNLSQRS